MRLRLLVGWIGCMFVSLYPMDLLGQEAAPNSPPPKPSWNEKTLAINVDSEADLTPMLDAAVGSGDP